MPIRRLFTVKSLFIFVIVALIAAFMVKKYVFPPPEKPNYITTPAVKRDLEQTVLADGTIEAQKQVSVGAQVSGQIKSLKVQLGDSITKGQLIAEIDDLPQQNQLKEAQAQMKNIDAQRTAKQAMLRSYQLTYQRQKQLLAKNLGAQADYDSALATLEATKAEIEALDAQMAQAEIAFSTAQLDLGYTKITSPIDGVIVAIPVEEGQTVNAVQSAPTIIKVAKLDTMTIKAQISEADVTKVEPGMPVYFTILGEPNKHYEAKLRAIEPAPDSINTDTSTSSSSSSTTTAIYYNGLFDVANTDNKLRISMTAQVYIILKQAKQAIVVPTTALDNLDAQGNAIIHVVDSNGRVESRKVQVGINNNVECEILSGLSEGEQVIISQGLSAGASGSSGRMGPPMRM